MSKAAQERASLIKRIRHCRDEIDQLFTDAEYWNGQHPPEDRIDPDPKGELVKIRASLQDALDREETLSSKSQADGQGDPRGGTP